mmetsp:Transcript_62022/g.107977  ORF Transcript_62022/g.107977 Transcript_62022/m.107977 type:complete len:259 (+) Transcript_62022:92-868(+)
MTKACLAILNLFLSSVTLAALAQEQKACAGEECNAAMVPGDEQVEGLEMLQFQSSKKPGSPATSADAKKKHEDQKHSSPRKSSSTSKLADSKEESKDQKNKKMHSTEHKLADAKAQSKDQKNEKVNSTDGKSNSTAKLAEEDEEEDMEESEDQEYQRAHAKSSQVCKVMPDTQWFKDEFPKGAFFEKGPAKFPKACALRCTVHEDCKSWTFKKEEGQKKGVCYLKDYGPQAGTVNDDSALGYVSGYKCAGTKKIVVED